MFRFYRVFGCTCACPTGLEVVDRTSRLEHWPFAFASSRLGCSRDTSLEYWPFAFASSKFGCSTDTSLECWPFAFAGTVVAQTPVDQFGISTPPPESGDHVPVDADAQEAPLHESQMNQQILELLQSMCGRLEALECSRSPHVEQSIAPSGDAPLSRHGHKEREEGDDLQHDLSENPIVDKKVLAHTRCPPLHGRITS